MPAVLNISRGNCLWFEYIPAKVHACIIICTILTNILLYLLRYDKQRAQWVVFPATLDTGRWACCPFTEGCHNAVFLAGEPTRTNCFRTNRIQAPKHNNKQWTQIIFTHTHTPLPIDESRIAKLNCNPVLHVKHSPSQNTTDLVNACVLRQNVEKEEKDMPQTFICPITIH